MEREDLKLGFISEFRSQSTTFPLNHPDFHAQTIILDDKFHVVAVIYWSYAHTVPLECLCCVPGSVFECSKSRLDEIVVPYREYARRLQSRYKRDRKIFIKALESMSTLQHELQPSDGPSVVLLSPLLQEKSTCIAAIFSEQSTAQNNELRELLGNDK